MAVAEGPGSENVGAQSIGALVGQIVNALTTIVLVVVLARTLGSDELGLYFVAVAIVTTLTLISTLGAATGLIRMLAMLRVTGETAAMRATLCAALIPTVVVSVLLAFTLEVSASTIAGRLSGAAQTESAVTYIRVLALAIPLWSIATVCLCALRGLGVITAYVVAENVMRPVLQLVFTVVAVDRGAAPRWVALAWTVPLGIELAVAVGWLWWRGRGWFGARQGSSDETGSWLIARQYWAFTLPQAVGGMVQIIAQRLDVVIVAALSTAAAAGVYGAATRYLAGGGMLLGAIIVAIGPRLSELFALHDRGGARRLYQRATAAVGVVGLPAYAVLALFAPTAMSLFGSGFTSSGGVLAVLATATFLSVLSGPCVVALALSGHTRMSGFATGFAAVVTLAIDFALVPTYGAGGAAVGYGVGIVVGNVLPLSLLWSYERIQPIGVEVIAILVAAGVSVLPCAILFRLVSEGDPSVGWVWMALSGILYPCGLWAQRGRLADAVGDIRSFRRPVHVRLET